MIKSSQCILYLGLAGSWVISVSLPSQANPLGGKDFTSALSFISSFSSGGGSSSVTATSSATATSSGDSGFSSSQSTSSAFSSSAGSGSSSTATATSPTGTPSSQSATVFTPGATSSSASATAAASTTSPNITSVTVAAPATSANPASANITSATVAAPATSANPTSANITSANITSAKADAPATIIPNAAGISSTLPVATFSNPNVSGTSRSSTVAATYISNFSLLSSLQDKSDIIEQRKDLSVENNNSSQGEGASYSIVGLGSRVFPGLGLRRVAD